MQGACSVCPQSCPECGHPLQTLWDYPSNEMWCLSCGNRFYQTISQGDPQDSLSGFHLIILELDVSRREMLTGRFANLGYQVTPVCHPRQALEAASFRHFDVAILPGSLPGLDAMTVIKGLRHQLSGVRFVVYFDTEKLLIPSELLTHDVYCVRVNMVETRELETALEHLIDDLVGAKQQLNARTRNELVPTTAST